MNVQEEEIAASNAPLLDHLLELRQRLIRSVLAFLITSLICFTFKEDILRWLLLPYQWAIKLFGGDPYSMRLQSIEVLETILTKIKLAAFGGIILAFPIVAFQAYRFIAPGLYKNERMAFLPFLIAAPVFFMLGGAFVYYIVAPLILWFSLSQQLVPGSSITIDFVVTISRYLSFMTWFILAFGLVFQLPVVTSLLVRVGLLNASMLASKRKWAIVAAFIVAAMISPGELLSMFGLALPIILLYEFSILLARLIEKQRPAGTPDSDDEEQSQS